MHKFFLHVLNVHLLKLVSMPTRMHSHLLSLLAVNGHIPPASLQSTSTHPPGDHLTHPGAQLLSLLSVKLLIHPPPNPLVVFPGERGEGRLEKGDREAGRQGDRETGSQGDRETGRKGGRETGRQGDRETRKQRVREAGRQETGRWVTGRQRVKKQGDIETERQRNWEKGRKGDRETRHRETERETGTQGDRETEIQRDRETGRKGDGRQRDRETGR